ncbi:ABC transporter ATP-binding protein [Microbispora sp. H10885]|uniref:ABC transporter ATP-binding protein n=1 Tax=Microbispora sp. H10885 TaxID=2729110 RepID=UPI0015FEC3E9|nr:ABC transporter ATP-binding protein [Microbispora sp. H10885]
MPVTWVSARRQVLVRLRLLKMLRAAGPLPVGGLVVVTIVESLSPAAAAAALGLLVGRLVAALGEGAAGLGALTLPAAALVGVMLVGNLIDSAKEPLHYLVAFRLDGAYRSELSRRVSTGRTIAALERPSVQGHVELARADPRNWTERTPGAGAVALVVMVGRALTLASTSVVLAVCAWWLVPLLVLPAIAVQWLSSRDIDRWFVLWRGGQTEYHRRRVWSDANLDAGPAKEVRIFGLGEHVVRRQLHHTREQYAPVWAHQRASLTRHRLLAPMVVGPLAAAMVSAAYLAATGRVSLAAGTAAISASAVIYRTFWGDPRDVLGAVSALNASDRLREALDVPPVSVPPEAFDAADASGASGASGASDAGAPGRTAQRVGTEPQARTVRFEGVSFTYPGSDRAVIDRLDLEIRPGELLAVVGLNGAGKSTLVKLLAGLYEPTGGRITYDGADIRDIGLDRWRRHLSVVFQDFVRYHLSVADNVALGSSRVPPDRHAVEAAGLAAGLDAVVDRLPLGWDTPLARTRRGGVDLSGGQWQQVGLARALYAMRTGARVLVLDEPTAHLDVQTEFEVFDRLATYRGDAAVVLISHRLSTVRQADRIVLIDRGRVTESGSHAQLMAADGVYANLFNIQAERFRQGYNDCAEDGEIS